MPHEELILFSLLVALQDLIFVGQELQDLLEHGACTGGCLWELRSRLLGESLEAFGAFAELVELAENLRRFTFEFLLQIFNGLLVAQLFLQNGLLFVGEQTVDLSEETLGWSVAMLEVIVEASLAKMRQYEEVVAL